MRARRRRVPLTEREAIGRLLAAAFRQWPLLPRGACVASYLSLPDEFPTEAINAALQDKGCRLTVPAWFSQTQGYRLAAWRPGDPLGTGPMRVPEPLMQRWVPTETIDVFLVPGLAFDRSGGRIGFGKGHYDRILAGRRAGSLCVAIGYDWQLVERVPQCNGDIPMDWIATPERFLRVAAAAPLQRAQSRSG
jgi:5-formyltetrahydrofolate cyclo-ligase